jgi:TetR/AcrR family fatty acid metabolism transcriptional regulator
MLTDATNQNILIAARKEFAKNGFHQTVVSDIASAAGVGKGTVYRHFGNKEQLFATLIKHGSYELRDRIEAAVSSGENPLESLQNCLDTYFDFFRNSRELIEIVLTEGKQRVGHVSNELKHNDIRIRSHLSALFRSGMDLGIFRSMDPDKIALLFHNTVWSMMRWAILSSEDIEFSRSLIPEIFLQGIRNPEAPLESAQ